jgi:hypothetical protein
MNSDIALLILISNVDMVESNGRKTFVVSLWRITVNTMPETKGCFDKPTTAEQYLRNKINENLC